MGGNVLVVNLTRFGDILQTQPLINDLHSSGYKTGLLGLENFSAATGLLRNLDYFAPLPGASVRAGADSAWSAALERVLKFATAINEDFAPDYIVNLTPSIPARLLSKLIAGSKAKILGFGMDEFGFGANEGVWATFFATAAQRRANAPFNVADMMRRMASRLTGKTTVDIRLRDPDPEDAAWARAFLGSFEHSTIVGFQLGASEERRRWPVKNFAALGNLLWKEKGIKPVLLGSERERTLAEEYASFADHPFIDAVGKTSLPRLAALLKELSLLVTNDTGTMHLAAGLGVPSLAFFMATAQPFDTGPLLPGSCCLEPALDCHPCPFGAPCQFAEKCRDIFKPEDAASLVLGYLEEGNWRAGVSPSLASSCRVWETGRDEAGLAKLEKIAGENRAFRSAWTQWQRRFWSRMLDLPESEAWSEAVWADLPEPMVPAKTAAALREAGVILDSARECALIAATNPRAGSLLAKNCERALALFARNEELAIFGDFWREFTRSQVSKLDQFAKDIESFSRGIKSLADALELRLNVA